MLSSTVPKSIGHYKLTNEIGSGATSIVFLAQDIHTNEILCAKVVCKETLSTEEEEKLFKKEIKIISSLNHPNIVKYYDFLENSTHYYLILEYCPGDNLQNIILKTNNLTDSYILNIFSQLLLALDYIHSIGVSHRDLKPENIIVGFNNKLKLIDFGFSTDNNNNLSSTFCGSLAFAAPECLVRYPYLPQFSDIWSSGLILYLMSSRKIPWKGENTYQIMKEIVNCSYSIPPFVSQNISNLIKDILKLNPRDRPTASQLLLNPIFKFKNNNSSLPIIHIKKVQSPRVQLKSSRPKNLISKSPKPNNQNILSNNNNSKIIPQRTLSHDNIRLSLNNKNNLIIQQNTPKSFLVDN